MESKTDFSCQLCSNDNCLIKKHIHLNSLQPYLLRKTNFRCNKGQQFVLEGTPVYGLYFIYSGCVKVYKHTSHHDAQIIRLSKNGEIVGHRGFGTNYVYTISAAAISDSVLCHFSSNDLIEMLHKTPELMFDFMLFYADQLQKSEANAIKFAKMNMQEKVINALHFIYRKFGQSDGFFTIKLSRTEIANIAGTSQEQVIRVISKLKKEGLIITEANKLGFAEWYLQKLETSNNDFFLEG